MDGQQPLKKYLTFSVLLHLGLLAVFIINLELSATMPVLENGNANKEFINASVLPNLPPKKIIKEAKPIPPPRAEVQPIPPKVIPVSKQVVQKAAIIIPDKKLERLKKEELIKKQLLSDLKKQKELQVKQQEVRKEQEVQKAFENEMKELNAKNLQQQMLLEQKRVTQEHTQHMNGEINKYKALILQSISQHWLVPPNVNKKLSAELLIRVAPGGTVLDVQLTKTSGDDALDRSARAAVFKASPLPVPKDATVFEPFRHFVLRVKPENVLTNDNWLS